MKLTAHSKKWNPIRSFNTQWGTVYSRDLAEFMKEEIMAICPKDVVNIRVLRRDDSYKILGPPIIKLEFEKDTLDPHIIIRWKWIQLRMKREIIICEMCLQFEHSKNYCKGKREFFKYCTEPLQEGGVHNCGATFNVKIPTRQETWKYLENI